MTSKGEVQSTEQVRAPRSRMRKSHEVRSKNIKYRKLQHNGNGKQWRCMFSHWSRMDGTRYKSQVRRQLNENKRGIVLEYNELTAKRNKCRFKRETQETRNRLCTVTERDGMREMLQIDQLELKQQERMQMNESLRWQKEEVLKLEEWQRGWSEKQKTLQDADEVGEQFKSEKDEEFIQNQVDDGQQAREPMDEEQMKMYRDKIATECIRQLLDVEQKKLKDERLEFERRKEAMTEERLKNEKLSVEHGPTEVVKRNVLTRQHGKEEKVQMIPEMTPNAIIQRLNGLRDSLKTAGDNLEDKRLTIERQKVQEQKHLETERQRLSEWQQRLSEQEKRLKREQRPPMKRVMGQVEEVHALSIVEINGVNGIQRETLKIKESELKSALLEFEREKEESHQQALEANRTLHEEKMKELASKRMKLWKENAETRSNLDEMRRILEEEQKKLEDDRLEFQRAKSEQKIVAQKKYKLERVVSKNAAAELGEWHEQLVEQQKRLETEREALRERAQHKKNMMKLKDEIADN